MVRNRIAKNAGVDFYVRDFAALVANGTNAPYVGNSLAYNPGGLRIPGTREGSFQFQFDQGVGVPEMSIIAGFALGRELPVGTHIANVSHSINYGFMFNGVVGEGLQVVHENTLVALPGLFSVGGEIYRVERTGSVMRYFANESLVYSATVTSSAYPLLPVGVLGFTGNAIVDSILTGGIEYVPREVDSTRNLYFLSVGLGSSGSSNRGVVAVQPSTTWAWTFADETQLSNNVNTTSKSVTGQLRIVTELRVNEGLSRLTSLNLTAGTALKQDNPLSNPTTLAQLTNLTSLILDGAYMGIAPLPSAPIATYQLSNAFPDRTNRLDFSAYAATLTSLNLSTSRLRLFPEIGVCTLLTSLSLQNNNLYDAGFYQGNQLANKTALQSLNVSSSLISQATINTMLIELATAVRTRSNPASPISNYNLGSNGSPTGATTTLTVDAAAGATSITVASTSGFAIGDHIFIEQRNNNEAASLKTITNISGNTITFTGSPGLTVAYFVLDTPPVTIPPTPAVPATVYNLTNGIGARQYIRRRGHTCTTS